MPALQSSQYAEPSAEVPEVHGRHAVMPDVFVKNPAPHSVHTVSELALHGDATFRPGAHTAHRSQYACPSAVAK